MVFEIETRKFWDLLSGVDLPLKHIGEITELRDLLGLSYMCTVLGENNNYNFRLEIVDKEKFFLAKIAYGL